MNNSASVSMWHIWFRTRLVSSARYNDDEQYIWGVVGWWFFHRVERHSDVTDGGQEKHEDHLLLEAQFEFLEDLDKKHFEFIGYSIEPCVEKSTEKEVTDSERTSPEEEIGRGDDRGVRIGLQILVVRSGRPSHCEAFQHGRSA